MTNQTGLSLTLDGDADTPLTDQIYWQIRRRILDGRLPPGTPLPPSRTLAQQHAIGRVTALAAYRQLGAEGYIVTRPGAGTYVAPSLPGALTAPAAPFTPALTPWAHRLVGHVATGAAPASGAPRPEIDFGFGRAFPHIFPYDIWRKLLARYLSTDDAMLARYGSPAGFLPLRETVAAYLRQQRGVSCTSDQVVIVSGAQQAIDLLARLLVAPGDEVLVETPGYTDALAVFEVHGARVRAIAVDDAGFPVAAIPARSRARLAYVTPANQFPRGGTMPLDRRLSLLHWARQTGAVVIEDDYDSELRYDGRPVSALQGLDAEGRVVYLGTFSKVLFPALRLGYVVLPPALHDPFRRAKGLLDRGAPTLTQAAVADFIVEGHFDRHLRRLRQEYGQRWAALQAGLAGLGEQVRYSRTPAGLHVMLYLPPDVAEAEFIRRAAAAGVGVYAGAPYHLTPSPPPSILLGFSGLTVEEIAVGMARLADLHTNQALP